MGLGLDALVEPRLVATEVTVRAWLGVGVGLVPELGVGVGLGLSLTPALTLTTIHARLCRGRPRAYEAGSGSVRGAGRRLAAPQTW